MELIDVIKSSVLLFIVISTLLIIVSFALYKIRNQAKKDEGSKIAQNQINKQFMAEPENRREMSPNPSKKPAKRKKTVSTKGERFRVINENFDRDKPNEKPMNINYLPNVFRFYEETSSDKMFKIKVND